MFISNPECLDVFKTIPNLSTEGYPSLVLLDRNTILSFAMFEKMKLINLWTTKAELQNTNSILSTPTTSCSLHTAYVIFFLFTSTISHW